VIKNFDPSSRLSLDTLQRFLVLIPSRHRSVIPEPSRIEGGMRWIHSFTS
jgi:hypothetical protein